jgi:NAD+ synthase
MSRVVIERGKGGVPSARVRQDALTFCAETLRIDAAAEAVRIRAAIREQVLHRLRKRGVVVGVSGGIDSAVTAALCASALGRDQVLALLMPERDSDPASLELGKQIAAWLGIRDEVEDIEPALAAAGCYRRRDELIANLVPEFGPGWRCKLALGDALQKSAYNITWLIARSPDGKTHRARMPLEAYLGIVAAANMKQRLRKLMEYTHADRLNYAVAGTANRLEHDQGFFVKNGDGAADLKPIAHLYKSQVYQLAEHLRVPKAIRAREPTTDTWSLEQTQNEFYFALPHRAMDLCLYALNHGISADTAAAAAGLTAAQVEAAWRDILAKRKATRYLHEPPLFVEPVREV